MHKFVLPLAASLLLLCTTVRSDCNLDIKGPSPLFVKNFGSRKIVFKAQDDVLKLDDDESVTAHCSTKLKIEWYGTLEKTVEFRCDSSKMRFVDSDGQLRNLDNYKIYCTPPSSLSLYESSQALPKCGGFSTYGIGNQMEDFEDFISAAICYDLDTRSLKYAHYIAYKPGYETTLWEEPTVKTTRNNSLSINLSKKLDDFSHYFKFMSAESFNAAISLKKLTDPLLQPFEFDYVSLLQDAPLQYDLYGFGYIFNTMWLRQLRLGNWRLYLNALEERTRSVQYAVYTGTHGIIASPSSTSCSKSNAALTVTSGNLHVDAPAYIWSYVKSLQADVVEEFVVIAHNSPYVENPNPHSFCADMCQNIDWLENSEFGKMRRKALFGYTFCCRPEEVAEIIENFPAVKLRKRLAIDSKLTTTTTEQAVTATSVDNFI